MKLGPLTVGNVSVCYSYGANPVMLTELRVHNDTVHLSQNNVLSHLQQWLRVT